MHPPSILRIGAPVLAVWLMAWGATRARRIIAIDRGSPRKVASAFLSAFAARDVDTMATIMLPHDRELWDVLLVERDANMTWHEIFEGWRWEGARRWNGEFETPRVWQTGEKRYLAFPYMTRENAELGILMLLKDDAGCYVDDIESCSETDFARWPEAES